ncbi:hypothetical protein ACIO6U_03005 [Streptomyces sp. NPDC087422]|uniref:hypothetical protein n=1 Tax=Streptomyces sp. NPDC087422 TaxID=3365786 RepID=UPI0037F37EB4
MTTIAQHAATDNAGHGLRAWLRRHLQPSADGSRLQTAAEIERLQLLLKRAEATDIGALEHELTQKVLQLAGADELIKGQRLIIQELNAQLAQAAANHVDQSVWEKQLTEAVKENDRLTAENRKLRSEIQNLGSIDVAPMHRDTTMPEPVAPLYERTLTDLGYPRDPEPDGETTQQVRVSTLAEAAAGGAL